MSETKNRVEPALSAISSSQVDAYVANDSVQVLLDRASRDGDESLTCQIWLRETPPKRLLVEKLYGDLLRGRGLKVLDVGGGLTALTRLLAERHDYELLDLLAHDAEVQIDAFVDHAAAFELSRRDWLEGANGQSFDVIVANDLFPNVDQRLAMFFEAYLPRCRQLRLSLTVYNTPRYYLTRRLHGEEILCVLAWDGRTLGRVLEDHIEGFGAREVELLAHEEGSPYPNGRQVFELTLPGALA